MTQFAGRGSWLSPFSTRKSRLLLLAICAVGVGCTAPDSSGNRPTHAGFTEITEVVSEAILEERPDDVIGNVGHFIEARNGERIIADALQPRIRRYSADGGLLAEFGAFGEGPFELRRIGGIAEGLRGNVLVVDPLVGRITVLTGRLRPDTVLRLSPPPRGAVRRFRNGFLLTTSAGSRARALTLFDSGSWTPDWSVPVGSPGSMSEYPYWGSVATTEFAASATETVVAYSLLYPIRVFTSNGHPADSLTKAPPSFRRIPRVAIGEFSGPGAGQRIEEWFSSFDVIADLSVVADSILVVTHGQLSRTPVSRMSVSHDRIDIYHLPSRSKIAEDISLPAGARVLGGGESLHLLTAQPPDPWRIISVKFDDDVQRLARK